jgi:hypothetical protein
MEQQIEKDKLMKHPVETSVDELLRELYEAPVADDGFCDRVMQKIPKRRKTNYVYLAVAFAVGMLAFLWQIGSTSLFQQGWHDLAQGQFSFAVMLVCVVFFGVSLSVSAWLLTEPE